MKKLRIIAIFLFSINVIIVKGQVEFVDYAKLNSTEISAESIDEEFISEIYNGDIELQGSWHQNDWYSFNFHQNIQIDWVEIYYGERTKFNKYKSYYNLILSDTIISFIVDSVAFKLNVNCKTEYLILERIPKYPGKYGHISEFKILSQTIPKNSKSNSPKINISFRKRMSISHKLEGLSKEQSKLRNKLWRVRKKFYNKNVKKYIEKDKKEDFEYYFDKQDSIRYCYEIERILDELTDEKVITLFDDCYCELRDKFFQRRMKSTLKMMERPFIYDTILLSYTSDTIDQILIADLERGDARAGHAIRHLCLMSKVEYLDKIESLKYDKNVFTQYQVMLALLYFKEYEKAKEVAMLNLNQEKSLIKKDSVSENYIYSLLVLKSLMEFYPKLALKEANELYKLYRGLYPNEIKNELYWGVVFERGYDQKIVKRVASMQGVDKRILYFIIDFLNENPEFKILKEAKEMIKYHEEMEKLKEKWN